MAPADNSSLDEVDYGAGFSNFLRTFLAVSLRGMCVHVCKHGGRIRRSASGARALAHDDGRTLGP